MKKILTFALITMIMACSTDQIEIGKAKLVAENLLNTIEKQDYAATSAYYSANFNQSESPEQRSEKFTKLRDALGAMESFQLTDSTNAVESGIEASAVLTYKVKRAKINSIEVITVAYDEGDYKVVAHQIKGDN